MAGRRRSRGQLRPARGPLQRVVEGRAGQSARGPGVERDGGHHRAPGYARYFTPPDTELIAPEDIALYAGTTNQLPNDLTGPVKAERSNYYDVGVSQKLGPHLTIGLDGYDRQVNYLQDEGQFGAALVFSPFNYAHGRARGIELSVNYDNGPLSAYFNLAQSRAMGKGVISGQYNFD